MNDRRAAWRDGDRRLRLCHRARPGELRAIRRRVASWAEQWGLPDDVLVDLQLALGEAVANGVEHAYRSTGDGTVDVDLEVRRAGVGGVVAVRVVDHGRWRPAPDLISYRGRGIHMIESLAQQVHVLRTGAGTEVCFEIPFADVDAERR